MKLTKVQQALLDRAVQNGGSASIECGGGRGPNGGQVSYGSRDRAALFKLADAGLVTITHRATDVEYNRGHGVRTTLFVYKLASSSA
jgi:hypothetical protein